MTAAGTTPPKEEAKSSSGGKDSQAVMRNAGWGMVAGAAQGAIRMVNSFLVARALGAEMLGVFHLSNRITKMGTLFSMSGQDNAVVHFVARHRATGDLARARGSFVVSVWVGLLLSAIMGFAVYALGPWISRDMFDNESMAPVVRTLALGVPLTVMGGIWTAGLRGTRKVKHALFIQSVLIPGGRLVLFVALLLLGYRLFGLVWALLGSLAIGLVYAVVQMRRTADWMQPGIRPIFDAGAVFRFSTPLIFLSLIDYANNSADLLVLGHYDGAAAAGIYGQAFRVLGMMKVPVSALSSLFVPLCAELYGSGQMERLREMFQATSSCAIRIAIPLMLGTVLFARPVMAVFGPEFVSGTTTLTILATILISNSFATLAGYAIYMSGRSWMVTLNQLFLAAVTILLYFLLVPKWGMDGAATARAAGWAAWAGLILFQSRRLFGFQPFSQDMGKGLVAGAAAFAVAYLLLQLEMAREHVLLVVPIGLLFVGIYSWLVVKLGLTEDERYILGRLGKKLRKVRKAEGSPSP